MKTTKRTVEEASDRLGDVPETQRLLYTNVCALRILVKELETKSIRRMATTGTTPGSSVPLPISDAKVGVTVVWRDIGAELSSAKVLLTTVEESAEFKECAAVVEPLVAELTELQGDEEVRRLARAGYEAALERAREAARKSALATALEAAEKDPAVLAAKQKILV